MAAEALEGVRFSRLLVLRKVAPPRPCVTGSAWYECRCDCGVVKVVMAQCLRSGGTKSCGCLRKDYPRPGTPTHGMTGTPTYNSWRAMKQRCAGDDERWGGRGITICKRWLGRSGLTNFIADMGERPPGLTLDRINNDGNYEPSNCRWATPMQQTHNSRPRRMRHAATSSS